MCGQDKCVEMVKEMTAELFREQRELVRRLNAMQERISLDQCLVSKTRRKIEWMEEKERTVGRLKKIVASLHDALEADAGRAEADAAAASNSDGLSDDDTASEASDSPASRRPSEVCEASDSIQVTSMRHPRAFSRIFCDEPPKSESFVTKIQTELYTAFITNLDQGNIRIATPREERRILLEPPIPPTRAGAPTGLPHAQPRALWLAQSDDGGQTAVRNAASSWMSRSVRRLSSMPELPNLGTFPRKFPRRIHRLGTAVKNKLIGL